MDKQIDQYARTFRYIYWEKTNCYYTTTNEHHKKKDRHHKIFVNVSK